MVKVVKISDETYEDLQIIQNIVINYGTQIYPPEAKTLIESFKGKSTTYKTIIAIAVKVLREVTELATPLIKEKEEG